MFRFKGGERRCGEPGGIGTSFAARVGHRHLMPKMARGRAYWRQTCKRQRRKTSSL